MHQISLVAGLRGQAGAFADHLADTVHRFARSVERGHGRLGGRDVFVGEQKTCALGGDAHQRRCPLLLCVALSKAVLCNRIACMHGFRPSEAHVKSFLGTEKQVGLCSLQAVLYSRGRGPSGLIVPWYLQGTLICRVRRQGGSRDGCATPRNKASGYRRQHCRPIREASNSRYVLLLECVLYVAYANLVGAGEDADCVEAQGVEGWVAVGDVVCGEGADSTLLA
jgi:hypothetical protein